MIYKIKELHTTDEIANYKITLVDKTTTICQRN
jgi:hypothetical protein